MCVHVFVFLCICIYVSVSMHVCLLYVCSCVFVCGHICLCVYIFTCMNLKSQCKVILWLFFWDITKFFEKRHFTASGTQTIQQDQLTNKYFIFLIDAENRVIWHSLWVLGVDCFSHTWKGSTFHTEDLST